jgi:hypothetical protein
MMSARRKGLRGGIEWRTPGKNHVPNKLRYLQEKGEPHTKPQMENTKYN